MTDLTVVNGGNTTNTRDFAAFLMDHARGRTHDELTAALRDVVLAVEETGKVGRITYTLTIRPQERVDGAVVVSDDVKVNIPTLDRPQSVFFATQKGDLVRNDPRQPSMFDPIKE